MALDKAIKSGKEHRKEYRGSKSFDRSCRNHGGCPWCEENRQYKNIKRIQMANEKLEELMRENQDVLIRLKNFE